MILQNCSSPAYSGIKGRMALHAAVILNDQAMTKKILDWKPDLTQELDEDGWSPLHFATYLGCHPRIVTQLLEKSERHVVYLGVKDHEIGNRTALHIAASRGHVEVVKVLLSHFPDCCEQVDDQGSNVLHLIMSDKKTFVTSDLSNIRWLRVRGLMNEKNVEGKTPLQLFDINSTSAKDNNNLVPQETMFTAMLNTFVGLLRWTRDSKVRMRPSCSSLAINEGSGTSSSESKEREEISEMKKTIKSHMIVAALIATVTFAAGFTLPGGYVQSGSNNQPAGMAVFSLPTNTTDGSDQDIANAARLNFRKFVMEDSIAMVLSMCAIGIYFFASFPIKDKKTIHAYLWYGYALTMGAMSAMVIAFVQGLQAALHPSSVLESTTAFIVPAFYILLVVPIFLTLTPSPRWILYPIKVKSYTSM